MDAKTVISPTLLPTEPAVRPSPLKFVKDYFTNFSGETWRVQTAGGRIVGRLFKSKDKDGNVQGGFIPENGFCIPFDTLRELISVADA